MSIKIVYKGFSQDIPSSDAVATLTRLFKGDQAKAEEVFLSKSFVLQTVSSESELQLILPRLQKMGLHCEVVDETPEDAEDFNGLDSVVSLVTCPACQCQQVPADECRECGQSFVVKKINWKPAEQRVEEKPAVRQEEEERTSFLAGLLGLFALPPLVIKAIALVAVGGVIGVGSSLLDNTGAGGEQAGKASASNPIMALIKGIMTSDPKKVAKTMDYDPEAGTNPYADRLKSLGIDPKEFAQSTGVEGGEISADQINAFIEKNPLMKGAIANATGENRSADHSGSKGNTETDAAIRKAVGEE